MHTGNRKTMRRGLVETEFGYIHYRHTGDHHAQAIVLSHINQQSSALMIELLEKLGRTLHAVAIDYPSCGMSDHVAEQPAIHDYATVIIRVLDALKIDKASTLGEAGGAFVSADLAATYPDRVQNAILVNCPSYGNEDTKHRAHTPLKTGLRPDDASGFPMTRTLEFVLQQDPGHAPLHPTQSWMDRINVAAIEAGRHRWQVLDAIHAYDLPTNLKKIRCPTLLMMGEHFHYVQDMPTLQSYLANSAGAVIQGGRFCMTWEHAGEITERTLKFINKSST